MSDVELYGKIGMVIAHEIGHSVTGSGAYYNANGVYVPSIYKDSDIEEYNKLCLKLASYLNTIEAKDNMMVDGICCLSETMADILSGEAMIQVMKDKGYSNYGDFAKAFAEYYFVVEIPNMFDYYYYDCHLLNNIRTNVVLQMQKEICEYYGFVEGDKMYLAPEDRVVIFG